MSPVPDLNGLATIRADHVTPKRVKWIWKGRIPAGKVTMLDGDPGLGKSTITTDLTARVTTATAFPDGDPLEKRRCVLLLSAEDSAEDTIVPRLKVAGADLRLVTILDHVVDPDGGPRQVELPADIDRIEKWCASLIYSDTLDEDSAWTTPGLVIIDPLMAFFAGEVNAHRDQDVRRVLYRLKVMAEETGCAVVCVRHLNKMPGTNPLYRGGGSIGIIGAARAGLLVGADPDDGTRSILAVSKNNLGAKRPASPIRWSRHPSVKVTTRSRPAGSSGRASAPTALRTCSVIRLSGPPPSRRRPGSCCGACSRRGPSRGPRSRRWPRPRRSRGGRSSGPRQTSR